jgi:glycosyltransferase involved in cell wall biosynthesis
MTIHGVRPLEVPADRYEFRYADGWRRRIKTAVRWLGLPVYVQRQRNRLHRLIHCASRSTAIVVPSFHTKHALLGTFPGLDPTHVVVAYSPLRRLSEPAAPDAQLLAELELEERGYFLLVNAGRWIKNAQRAIMALDRFFGANPCVKLRAVLTGIAPGQVLSRSPRHADRFIFRDYVPSHTLETLYAKAFALVYPTLNEGFGYPPLEAMRWGTPVICSAVASVPEVCEAAVLYVAPKSVAEIENRVSQLVLEPRLWDRYAQRGPKRHSEVEILQGEGLRRICALILGRD